MKTYTTTLLIFIVAVLLAQDTTINTVPFTLNDVEYDYLPVRAIDHLPYNANDAFKSVLDLVHVGAGLEHAVYLQNEEWMYACNLTKNQVLSLLSLAMANILDIKLAWQDLLVLETNPTKLQALQNQNSEAQSNFNLTQTALENYINRLNDSEVICGVFDEQLNNEVGNLGRLRFFLERTLYILAANYN